MGVITATFLIGACFLLHVANGAPQPYSTDLETELRTALFTGYEVLQRPQQTVQVTISFNLLTINTLDIRNQKLSTTGYFTMSWMDTRLEWASNSTYDEIRFIFSNEDYMWRPAIVIENSVGNLAVISDANTLIRIISTGTASWTPGGVFSTNCEADVTYYPLDTQTCSITLSTWAYTSNEVWLNLATATDPFNLEHYTENGEWEIIEVTTSSSTSSRKGDTNSYSRLYYTVKLRRRPLFHILNTIFPVILMASLIIFVFKLPPESGERVGMSLTVLLAYAVYLTLISESIPQTSLSASILSTYLSIILMLSALSVVFTIIVLDIYFNHEDDEAPPAWLQKFTSMCLVRFALWKGNSCCHRSRKVRPMQSSSPDSADDAVVVASEVKFAGAGGGKGVFRQDTNANQSFRTLPSNDGSDVTVEEEEDGDKVYSWKEVALILDRFFMYLFVFLIVGATLVCMLIMGMKYKE